jgi:hypothetical protein
VVSILENLKIPLKRKNIDKTKNKYGNMLLNFCKANQLFIVNSRIGYDKYVVVQKMSTGQICFILGTVVIH